MKINEAMDTDIKAMLSYADGGSIGGPSKPFIGITSVNADCDKAFKALKIATNKVIPMFVVRSDVDEHIVRVFVSKSDAETFVESLSESTENDEELLVTTEATDETEDNKPIAESYLLDAARWMM